MDDLKRIYRRALAARIQALDAALAALTTEPGEARSSLRRLAHSLRGSGASYGFAEVTSAAAALEESDDAGLEDRARELLAVLHGIAEAGAARTVLVVDDDPEMQLLLRAVLQAPDVQVEIAETAAAAQQRVRDERFDLILLDLLLPDADGRKVLLTIRDTPGNATTPVFVLSAKSGAHARTECFALGANGFFEKPFDPATVAAAVSAELLRGAVPPAHPESAPHSGRDIAVVEDDELVASILKHRLEREGFTIHHYADGTNAAAALERGGFMLAIIDVKLPGMDGFQLLERVRSHPGTTALPVIMLTALGGERDVVRGLELGANDYVIKPFSPVELIARVHRLLTS